MFLPFAFPPITSTRRARTPDDTPVITLQVDAAEALTFKIFTGISSATKPPPAFLAQTTSPAPMPHLMGPRHPPPRAHPRPNLPPLAKNLRLGLMDYYAPSQTLFRSNVTAGVRHRERTVSPPLLRRLEDGVAKRWKILSERSAQAPHHR